MPKVTVLMPVYNGEKYLKEAIESILNQTFKDFEFLIINDGSTDNSVEIINSYKDPRIKLIHNERNIKLIATLNKGITMAIGEYIARMDCDDISLRSRLSDQVKFMDSHKNIGICGSWMKTIGQGSNYINKFFTEPEEIKVSLLFNTSLAHPAVIIRREMLLKHNLQYDGNYPHAEDYELWSRASNYFQLANIPKALLLHRVHKDTVSHQFSNVQINNSIRIKIAQLQNMGIEPTDEEIKIHRITRSQNKETAKQFIDLADHWLNRIKKAPKAETIYTEPEFSQVLYCRWLTICQANTNLGFWLFKRFRRSDLTKNIYDKKWGELIKFFIKCLIKK